MSADEARQGQEKFGADAWLRIIGAGLFAFLMVELEKWLRYGREGGRGASPE